MNVSNNLSVNNKEYIWIEKYRPKNLDDIVLPKDLKSKIQTWIDDAEMPNIMLSGRTPGTGKSSLCHVLIHELDADALFINSSLESNIDTLRIKIQGFESTASYDGRPKIVILDEADGLNPKSTQLALKGFIEQFSKGSRFILTCNHKQKLIEPLRNRLIDIDFDDMSQKDKEELIKGSALRAISILQHEKVTFKKEDLIWIIRHFYPSSRKIVNKLQEHSTTGELIINRDNIDSDTLNSLILENIQNKNFDALRDNISKLPDPSSIFLTLYEHIDDFKQEIRPQLIITIAKWQSYDSQVRDRLINSVACAVEVMEII